MVVVMIGLLLLAAVVMFILNLGVQTNQRVVAQHAADSSATAGAGWVARSFNTVAMNNVATTRLISFVNILDAMPTATRFTHEDQTALYEAIGAHHGRGDFWVNDALRQMDDEVAEELRVLEEMIQFFDANDVTEMTYYNAPNGRGSLWEAMHSLDEFSQVTMDQVGRLAQLNAIRGGQVNQGDDAGASATLMVPPNPTIPWQRGRFDDFQDPTLHGLLPAGSDHQVTNRGPYDTVFGWRDLIGDDAEGYWVGGNTPRVASGGRNPSPIGTGADNNNPRGHFVRTGTTEPTGYRVFGPYTWMKWHVGNWHNEHMHHARFGQWERTIADIKMGYLWPGTPIRTIVDPQWVTDYNEALALAAQPDPADPATGSPRPTIHETAYILVEIKSLYPRSDGRFMSPGTWSYVKREHHDHEHIAHVRRVQGWVDAATWGLPKVADHIWRGEWSYEAWWDDDIGLPPQYDANGAQQPYTIHRVDDYIFAGVNIGEEVDVPSPHNFDSRDDLPAPIDMDRSIVSYTPQDNRQYLTYLSISRRSDQAVAWPSRFTGRKPFPNNVAIAQAHVFNNHSWDLWTQMWYSQLQAVDGYEDWMHRMDDNAGDLADTPWVDPNEYDAMQAYLESLSELAPGMLSH
jgi:hypothetical protein